MSAPDDLELLRQRANETLLGRFLDPVGGPTAAAQSPDVQNLAPGRGEAPFDVALGPVKARVVRGLMHVNGADKRLDATLSRMTGGSLSSDQIHELEARALRRAEPEDIGPLTGIEEGPPIVMTPQQKAIIDRLILQSGSDVLGRSAQKAYDEAWRRGQIRLRAR